MTLILPFLLFLVVAGAITLFGYRRYVLPGQMYENLSASIARKEGYRIPGRIPENPFIATVVRFAEAVGTKLPPSAETATVLQGKLLGGGYRNENAVAVFYGLKMIAMVVTALLMIAGELKSDASLAMRIAGVLIGVAAGYRLPDYVLARRIKGRAKRLRKALPDALDLVTVCAEAGLTMERAFKTVAQQLSFIHRDLSEEFNLFTAEITAGLRRKEALENLALRTQEPEIRKFVGVLSQADRFGTSMGEALRTHSEYLRIRRRHEAEERASKVSVKLIFPIFFFIMPCMMLVTVGPAVLVIAKQLIPAMQGGH